MKKILLSLVVFSLVFVYSSIGLVQAQEQNQLGNDQRQNQPNKPQNNQPKVNAGVIFSLEKIPNPGQIGFFEKIQKIGPSLFGIRKQQNDKKSDQKNSDQSKVASGTDSILEKISSPAEISLFDKIKKVGPSLWGVRKNNNNQKQKVNQPKPVYVTPAAAQCVKDAIDKKDASLKARQVNHAQSISLAIDTRGTCQKTALDQATAKTQADANKLCVDAFQKGINDINKTMEMFKKDIFETYKNNLKDCSALQVSSTATSTAEAQTEQIMIPDEVAPVDQSAEQQVE